ncbi:hypothetical protein ABIA44_007999 [Bradyrhizobium sp. USDA 329]
MMATMRIASPDSKKIMACLAYCEARKPNS